jgi:uncharacterized protein
MTQIKAPRAQFCFSCYGRGAGRARESASVIVGDQAVVLDFLRAAMAERGPVEEVETHISHLILGPVLVWKLKRAVRLPYADLGTPERRLGFCEREVALNRRTAPDHYLGVRRITSENGRLAFDGAGDLVDALVEMRRFDQEALLDRLATRGELTPDLMERLAAEMARFHATCAPDPQPGSQRVAEVLAVNEAALGETTLFPRAEVDAFNAAFRALAEAHRARLDHRGREGRVRLAHGDLHLRNIFLENERPVLFDCIEFNDAIATVDLLYDLAFLLMDLVHRGLHRLANLVMNRYLDLTGDEAGLPLQPFFMGLRAAVRAHVTATTVEEGGDTPARRQEARAYFDLALALIRPRSAVLVAIGGLSGSGKSSVAAALAPMIGGGAGARILSSDRLRKTLHGVPADQRLPAEAYAREVSARVYRELEDRAQALAAAGVAVVADAVFADPAERARIEAAARAAGIPFNGIWLDAPAQLLRDRVAARKGGPSDATLAVLERQLAYDIGPMTWTWIKAGPSPEALALEIQPFFDATDGRLRRSSRHAPASAR